MAHILDVEETLAKLSLNGKIKLLAGNGWWHTHAVPEADVPPMRMSDGPNGVRGLRFFNGVPASCFPSSTGLGSSFDVDLALQVGKALGDEARAKSCHILLAPTVNTQRSPLGGRGFESFSEDPVVNGNIAAAYINGVQSKGVAATIKHYVANDQEFQSERALREIYLKPFQIALRDSDPWALMTAYNRVNGIHVSEDKKLIHDILREEWGYKGMTMSDWIGVYSTSESISAGLDLEMPGPTVMRGKAVERALAGEKLFLSDVDNRVRKILELIQRAQASGVPFNGPEEGVDTPELRQLLRTAASDAIVLLKNEKKILPLSSQSGLKRIAVIGPNAKQAFTSGGGSARLLSTYTVSPLEGITAAAKELGAEISYTIGATSHKYLPEASPFIKSSHGGKPALLEFWNESPNSTFLNTTPSFSEQLTPCAWSTPTANTNIFLADGVDTSKYSTIFVPDEDGDWEFGLNIAGNGNLFLDGKLVIDLSTSPEQGENFFAMGTVDLKAVVKGLKAGEEHNLEIRLSNEEFVARGCPLPCHGGLRLGAFCKTESEEALKKAVQVAKDSDVAIVVVGLNHEWESEGYDRPDLELPGLMNRLVSEVLRVNPKTVVVNQSGTPVSMPWVNEAPTLVQAFYGGNELGNGLADVLFGKVNPSGKLALTFPKRLADTPSYPSYGPHGQEYGKILYNEGIFVGYRSYEIRDLAPLFAFGYGLSYTTFEYSGVETSAVSEDGHFSVSFTVKNTGSVTGREAAQVYISDPQCSLPRPVKELKGFTKVTLKAGEAKKVQVNLNRDALSFYDERQMSWVAEAGKFDVFVAASSDDVRLSAQVELTKSFTWKGL
ncbi:glycoside hydrolase family 3 protein [Serpula lacrymans var. lacrymans S7.9]|uniref:beta-glucosidase n=1 Tax=Serpula lacrymans var. lacrymans (strain S7.9) TaxID=578457 RepID=F8NNV8_SERL9|nr:glycoside hydrolase family 3 protein [Serpula lacrymans var. lacrymans S7.9]EGO27630.1 glycoside hydrolase family 3 protein [Serpula lacrymans var. lacrymans S7.9]